MAILSEQQGQALVRLARVTIESQFAQGCDSAVEDMLRSLEDGLIFQEKHGVFVTLTNEGRLRGCIGNLSANLSVLAGVQHNALSAAFSDYRFRPLQLAELSGIAIEVSVLSEPQRLEFIDTDELIAQLRPGIDGVILRQGAASATFLPQVWEQLPNREEFMSHLCHKAGLPPAAWRCGNVEIENYQVQYFAEKTEE